MTESTHSNFKTWWQSGAPWIWLNAGAVSASILVVFGLIGLIAVRGMSHFWPADIQQIEYADTAGQYRIVGELVESENINREQYIESGLGDAPEGQEFVKRWLVKTGNREILSANDGK